MVIRIRLFMYLQIRVRVRIRVRGVRIHGHVLYGTSKLVNGIYSFQLQHK